MQRREGPEDPSLRGWEGTTADKVSCREQRTRGTAVSSAKGDSSEGEGGAAWRLRCEVFSKPEALCDVNKYLIGPSRKQTKVRILPWSNLVNQ